MRFLLYSIDRVLRRKMQLSQLVRAADRGIVVRHDKPIRARKGYPFLLGMEKRGKGEIPIETGNLLRVTMFGEFKVTYEGREIVLKSGKSTKSIQIFQYLLCNYPDGVPTETILEHIFGNDEVVNPRNNLKVSVSQLRKQLAAAGLPGKKFITVTGGRYCWCDDLVPTIDVNEFIITADKAQTETNQKYKLLLLRQAIDLYSGNFLPHLSGIDWAEELNAYYIRRFSEAVRAYADILEQEDAWEEILPVAEKANRILHMEEWQVLRIECLMRLGRWEEAKRVYNEAVAALQKEYHLPPSKELSKQYDLISRRTVNHFGTFDEVLKSLEEDRDTSGAYLCTFPGFIDLYRVAVRSMLRSGINCCIMLCTVCSRDGEAIQNTARLAEAAERASTAIGSALRRGDFYAWFNESQFVICLSGTCLENCDIVSERIKNYYQKAPVRGAHLSFEVKPALVDDFSADDIFNGWN